MTPELVASVEHLRVETLAGTPIIEDMSISIAAGHVLGLVGESGSGKTTASLALLGFAARGVRLGRGSVRVAGEQLLGRPEAELRQLRGRIVSYVPQDPSSALNPSLRVADQIGEMLRVHAPDRDRPAETKRVLEAVHLPTDRGYLRRFPHELSGGQQQRLAIAVALVGRPPLIVLDEPTTGLDVVTQARIIEELARLRSEFGIAMVYVSHDLAVVSSIADRVAVMYAGTIVEEGPANDIFRRPRHPYTRGLVSSIPDHVTPRRLHGIPGIALGIEDRQPGCPFAPRCDQRVTACTEAMPPVEAVDDAHTVRCLRWAATPSLRLTAEVTGADGHAVPAPLLRVDHLRALYHTRGGTVVAADDVSFDVGPGDAVALVGESGSGKTTIARCVVGLVSPAGGQIALDGIELPGRARARTTEQRRRIQIVFQNPYDSLNPRHRVLDAVARPAVHLRRMSRSNACTEAYSLLDAVGLSRRLADRYPRELSGGERQRVAIGRALAARPDLLVCDEITSALDVSVQATVLALLTELQGELRLALLFISHDLGVVASLCDRALVLQNGVVREQGRVADLLQRPDDEYTRLLVDSAPRLDVATQIA
jgi:peptide/nickel transport system ATP-binding protein